MKNIIIALATLATASAFAADVDTVSWNSLSGTPALNHIGAYIYRTGDTIVLAFKGNPEGRTYSGTATANDARITSYSERFTEKNDYARRLGAQAIQFRFDTHGETDRLSFQTDGSGEVMVRLKVDGQDLDGIVKIGDGLRSAQSNDGMFLINLPGPTYVAAPAAPVVRVAAPVFVAPKPIPLPPVVVRRPVVVRKPVVAPIRVVRRRH